MNKKKIKHGSILSVLVLFVIFIAILIKAYFSGQDYNNSTNEDTTKTETTVDIAKEEQTEKVATTKPTEEPTPKPTPVLMPDTNSTLPGVEWIQSFNGIIEEPKLVVFNDENNKKIIIEDSNQEVEFYDNDTLAIYIPDNNGKVVRELKFEDSECYDSVVIFKNISSSIMRDGYVSATIVDIEFDGEPMTLYCYLKLMG